MEMIDFGARAFARIADLSSISAAARALSLPKSSISRPLTRLEREVGATLVERLTRHLRLTDAGVLFRPCASASSPMATRPERNRARRRRGDARRHPAGQPAIHGRGGPSGAFQTPCAVRSAHS